MLTTTGFSFGDVVFVPFPFSDQSISKRRPAVIDSSAAYHRARPDVIVMAVTSQQTGVVGALEPTIRLWQEAGPSGHPS